MIIVSIAVCLYLIFFYSVKMFQVDNNDIHTRSNIHTLLNYNSMIVLPFIATNFIFIFSGYNKELWDMISFILNEHFSFVAIISFSSLIFLRFDSIRFLTYAFMSILLFGHYVNLKSFIAVQNDLITWTMLIPIIGSYVIFLMAIKYIDHKFDRL